MAKRKSAGSVTPPRKKAKLDQSIESPRLQTHSTDAASSSSCSLPSSPLPSTSQRPKKRTILDDTSSEGEDEWDARSNTKRIRTQSPTNSTRRSPTPNYEDWVLHDDNPEAQAHIYWEPTDLTERARRWREKAELAMAGYVNCSCGKMHYAIGRKSWHYPGQEPELEDPEESVPEPDEGYIQPAAVSAHQNRGQERLPTPELSDEEANVDNTQLNSTPIDVSILQESPTSPDSPAPIVREVPTVSPTITSTTTPTTTSTTTPTTTSTTSTSRVSRRRTSPQHDVENSKARRQTRRKNKNKEKKQDKGKPDQRQPRNRKPKTTLVAEEATVLRRSSRRNAASTMWFLDSSGKACSITASSR
ncbi:hypothetical protein V8C34DRAFT_273031 [Trichoderma compactum]